MIEYVVKPVLPRSTATVTAMPGLRDLQPKQTPVNRILQLLSLQKKPEPVEKLRLRSPNRYLMHIMHSKSSAFVATLLKKGYTKDK